MVGDSKREGKEGRESGTRAPVERQLEGIFIFIAILSLRPIVN